MDGLRTVPQPNEISKTSPLRNRHRMIGLLAAAAIALAGAGGARALAAPSDPQSARLATNSPAAQPSASDLAGTVANNGDGIAAIVNDTPISNYDLQQRMALFLATSGVRPNPEALKSIREQVLRQLETERLQLLEAQKNNITVAPADVDKAINNIVSDNRLTMDQLKNLLSQSGVAIATLRSQIATQIAWSKLVADQYGDRIHVTPEEVDAELARIKNGANKPRIHVFEIFEAVDTPEQDAKILKDMTDLYTQI